MKEGRHWFAKGHFDEAVEQNEEVDWDMADDGKHELHIRTVCGGQLMIN